MTAAQLNKLRRKRLAAVFQVWPLTVKLLVILIVPALIASFLGWLKNPSSSLLGQPHIQLAFITYGLSVAGMLTMLALYALVNVIWAWYKIRPDVQNGNVRTITGRLHFDTRDKEVIRGIKYQQYELRVNGIDFIVSQDEWLAFQGAVYQPYCTYYAPNSKIILSVEPYT